MKTLPVSLAMLFIAAAALAQLPEDSAAEHARIAAERGQAEARYAAEEKACYAKFAVNDCQNQARVRRREVLSDLRRREIALNDAERTRKGAERLRDIQERSAPGKQRQADEKHTGALAGQQQRETRAAEKTAGRRSAEVPAAASSERKVREPHKKAAQKIPDQRKRLEAGDDHQRYLARVEKAKARKDRVEKKLAERNKPAPSPLPVPP